MFLKNLQNWDIINWTLFDKSTDRNDYGPTCREVDGVI